MVLAAQIDSDMRGELTGGVGLPMVLGVGVGAFVWLVGVTAATGPARRSLRIHPTDALREE